MVGRVGGGEPAICDPGSELLTTNIRREREKKGKNKY